MVFEKFSLRNPFGVWNVYIMKLVVPRDFFYLELLTKVSNGEKKF